MNQRIRTFKILKYAYARAELKYLPSYVDLVTALVNDTELFKPLYSSARTGDAATPNAPAPPPATTPYNEHAFGDAKRTSKSDFVSPYLFTDHAADPTQCTFNSDSWCEGVREVLGASSGSDDVDDGAVTAARRVDVEQGTDARGTTCARAR